MKPILISSPLQGFTDYRFRNAHYRYFGGIDVYYAPYIRLNGKMVIKPVYQRDLLPKHNKGMNIVPQVMTCNEEEFLFVIKYVQSLGYKELNWNLGCPYPMVINKGMGSGLVGNPDKIKSILDRAFGETDITISMKMRMGYYDSSEILKAFPVLNSFPLKSIGIHARIGQQLYEGGIDLDAFAKCIDHSDHTLYYNGDITSVETYRAVRDRFPTIRHFMLGRGLLADPFLPQMIKEDSEQYPEDRIDSFCKYHDTLFREFEEKLSGAKHVIMKMLSFWEYFAQVYPEPKRMTKKIKKCKTFEAYDIAYAEIVEGLRKQF